MCGGGGQSAHAAVVDVTRPSRDVRRAFHVETRDDASPLRPIPSVRVRAHTQREGDDAKERDAGMLF